MHVLLRRINLSGNNFSLPAGLRCLSKLWELNLESCKSLQQAVNGFRLVENNEGCNSIAFLMLQKFRQGVRHSILKFNIVIPGSEIPDWFSNQSVGDSLMVERPPHLLLAMLHQITFGYSIFLCAKQHVLEAEEVWHSSDAEGAVVKRTRSDEAEPSAIVQFLETVLERVASEKSGFFNFLPAVISELVYFIKGAAKLQ
ncbi:unnamed protein product [Prunus brigantina]